MTKHYILLSYIFLFFIGCKEKEVAPPTLGLSNTTIDLGAITSTSTSSLTLTKNGEGTISYTIASNKTWLKLSKSSGTISTTDAINFSTSINVTDLTEGENTAILSITPTINGVISPVVSVTVKGIYKTTTISLNSTNLDFGTITANKSVFLKMTKIGTENLSFDVSSDKSWLIVDKNTGTLGGIDSLKVTVDTKALVVGSQTGNITIVPKVNGIAGKQTTVAVKVNFDDTITGIIVERTLSKNETWGGNISLNGNVTVPKGFTLTIKPGTIIKVKRSLFALHLVIDGKLVMNGDASNIIEMRSENFNPNDYFHAFDYWIGIFANGDIEMSYAYIKGAMSGISFDNNGILSTPTKAPSIHHVLFENCLSGISDFKSKFETTFYNLTFRDISLESIEITDAKVVAIKDSDFLSTQYHDISISTTFIVSSVISVTNSNFVSKQYNKENLYARNSASKVTAINCFGNIKTFGFKTELYNEYGSVFTNITPASSVNLNVGCGFANKYQSARLRAVDAVDKKTANQQMIEYKKQRQLKIQNK